MLNADQDSTKGSLHLRLPLNKHSHNFCKSFLHKKHFDPHTNLKEQSKHHTQHALVWGANCNSRHYNTIRNYTLSDNSFSF